MPNRWSFALVAVLALLGCSAGDGTVDPEALTDTRPRTRDAGADRPRAPDAPGLDGARPPDDAGALPDGDPPDRGAPPAGREVCGNGLDDDRNGTPDDNCPCTQGMTQRCYAGDLANAGVGACAWGTQTCEGTGEFGTWTACGGSVAPVPEVCDLADNNCDGRVDEGCACTMGTVRECYTGPPATRGRGACRPGTQTCMTGASGAAEWGPCTGQVTPESERCDGRDRDCDGSLANGCECTPGTTRPCYEGPAATRGVGACRTGMSGCEVQDVGGTLFGRCAAQVLPSPEVCEDGADNDCDGATDCMDAECRGAARCAPCTTGTVGELTTSPAEVVFVVDRSGSMREASEDGASKWDALRSAVNAVLPRLDASLFMGLLVFPGDNYCAVSSSLNVPVGRPNASRITGTLAALSANGNTPTYQALDTVDRYFRGTRSTLPRFIILATDGAPNCGSSLGPVTARIASIRSSLGIDTFVLGIPDRAGALRSSLNAMADAGGRPRPGAIHYYEARSTAEFETALRAITATSVGCVYRLPSRPTDPSRVTIQFDGVTVPRDPARRDGWEFTDATYLEVRFYGTACATLGSGSVRRISVRFNC